MIKLIDEYEFRGLGKEDKGQFNYSGNDVDLKQQAASVTNSSTETYRSKCRPITDSRFFKFFFQDR